MRANSGVRSVLPTRVIAYAWGEKYIDELLSLTLPALLAPGNLPHVASAVPCELIILTEEAVFPRFLGDPTVGKIRELCPVRLVGLDDLIPAPDKYGMALTHVLHRGLSDLGPAVTDAWLLFLNADFILADGSLRNLLRHLADGKRLVASPSYCVNAEAVAPQLVKRVDPRARDLSLAPREMARLVLRHRHNTIRGKTVNQRFFSARYMDQFYWLADDDTLLGHQMPIAIVGMRPERYVAEPNCYWDHGLIKEFFPTTEAFVIGDSDEFLMLELRGEKVAQDQLRMGWPEPSEIARNTISFLTAYQKEMARHPLTLHAAELPAHVDDARAKLRAFVDGVLAHVPAVLPSHLDHPQWDYHRPGFIEARHKYLSTRLGSATETNEPPATLSDIDKAWWRLDGLGKSYARRRADLEDLIGEQRSAVAAMLTRIEQSRRSKISERLMRDLDAAAIDPHDKAVELGRVVQCRPGETGPAASSVGREGPWAAPIRQTAEEWIRIEDEVREKKELLTKAMEFIDQQAKEGLARLDLELESARRQAQSDYDRLMNRRVASAAIPHVVVRHGPQRSDAAASGHLLLRLARDVYHRCYGRLPRVQPLHPYWAAMRHLIRVVDTAAQGGAANVLVVVGSTAAADSVADQLPGLHAQVSLAEVIQGNLVKAFSEPPDIDLCICTLGPAELNQFANIVQAVSPCMRRGGKIVGFYPNFGLDPISVDGTNLPWSMFDAPASARIHYAGSAQSARVVRRFHRMLSASGGTRLAALVRAAVMLSIVTPTALAANRREAAAPDDRSSRMPAQCTSITIEITV